MLEFGVCRRLLADSPGERKNANGVTGKTLAATRLYCLYRRGAGNLTRSRRCWRYGAARALLSDPNPLGLLTPGFVAVVPADAKSIATSPVRRNPRKLTADPKTT